MRIGTIGFLRDPITSFYRADQSRCIMKEKRLAVALLNPRRWATSVVHLEGVFMNRALSFLLAACWVAATWAETEDYGFPFDDPFVATVVGTPAELRAELPEKIPTKSRSLRVLPDRQAPDFYWYDQNMRYAVALQRRRAPLVFLIAGTGARYNSAKTRMMSKAFYQAGFHTVSLSSPTHTNFIVSASSTAVPGHAIHDAEDLYRAMQQIWTMLERRIEVTDFYVTGYSLGGFNTAFVTWLDEERKVFNFKKALLINPPLRLYSSVSLLDRMIENIPGGVDNFNIYFDELVEAFAKVYKRSDVRLDENFLYRAYETLQPTNEELAALVGVSFRLSSANLTFVSDVVTDFGYIKPKNVRLRKNSDTIRFEEVAIRLGFTDYFHEYFYPFYKARDPSLDRRQLAESMSLDYIEDYLSSTEKIEVMHNADDIILEPGEIDFFPRVFGERAKIYPRGGHCGNMEYKDNVAHMVSVFAQ